MNLNAYLPNEVKPSVKKASTIGLTKSVKSRGEEITLVRLFTPIPTWVNVAQLANLSKIQLPIFTARGERLSDVMERNGKSSHTGTTVHRGNLFATPEMANEHREMIYADLREREPVARDNDTKLVHV